MARPTRMRRRSRNAFRASTSSFAEPALPRRLSLAADKATPTAASRTAPLVRPPRAPPRPRRRTGRPQAGTRQMVLPRSRLLNAYAVNKAQSFRACTMRSPEQAHNGLAERFAVPKDRGIRRRTACSGACAAARPTRMRRRSRNAFRASTSSFAEPALPRRLSLAADKATPTAASRTAPLVRPPRAPPRPRRRTGRPQAGTRQMVLPRSRLLNAYAVNKAQSFRACTMRSPEQAHNEQAEVRSGWGAATAS